MAKKLRLSNLLSTLLEGFTSDERRAQVRTAVEEMEQTLDRIGDALGPADGPTVSAIEDRLTAIERRLDALEVVPAPARARRSRRAADQAA